MEKQKKIHFTYSSNYELSNGENISDEVLLDMTDEEETLFRDAVKKFKEEDEDVYDLCDFFEEILPADLAQRLEDAINYSFDCCMLRSAGFNYEWLQNDITKEEWNKMNDKERLDLYMKINFFPEPREWNYTDVEILG